MQKPQPRNIKKIVSLEITFKSFYLIRLQQKALPIFFFSLSLFSFIINVRSKKKEP